MEPTAQVVLLFDKLLDLTRDGKVDWQETAEEDTFLAAVPKFVVTIGKERGSVYHFEVADEFGRTLERIVSEELPRAGVNLSDKLAPLHDLARRRALHSDAAISDLLSSLATIR